MSKTKRKNFTGEFKAKVALEAIRGLKTVNEIGQEFGYIRRRLAYGRKNCKNNHPVCLVPSEARNLHPLASPGRRHEEIGQLKMELDRLKKSLGSTSRKLPAMG